MYEGQSQTSEPGSMPPQAPPPAQPAPAPAPAPSQGRANAALVAAVIALAIALIGMIAFPGPEGKEGPQGIQGVEGDEGPEGDRGPTGPQGPDGPQGPAGPQGPQGPQGPNGTQGPIGPAGPAGPGALMSYVNFTGTIDIVGCTNFNQITITVPQAGWVVVYATAYMKIEHTLGTDDGLRMVIDPTSTDCPFGPNHWQHDIPGPFPSDAWNRRTPMLFNVFEVNGAGTYTFYLNGQMYFGESAGDQHRSSNMLAVFYPS